MTELDHIVNEVENGINNGVDNETEELDRTPVNWVDYLKTGKYMLAL